MQRAREYNIIIENEVMETVRRSNVRRKKFYIIITTYIIMLFITVKYLRLYNDTSSILCRLTLYIFSPVSMYFYGKLFKFDTERNPFLLRHDIISYII